MTAPITPIADIEYVQPGPTVNGCGERQKMPQWLFDEIEQEHAEFIDRVLADCPYSSDFDEQNPPSNYTLVEKCETESSPAIAKRNPGSAACLPLPDSVALDPALGDDACPWLDGYVKFSKKWAPCAYEGYHEAVGLWVLATVAARRVAFPLGKRRYTSLYIALLGRTSVWTKTTAAEIGMAIISECGLDRLLTSDEATPQAFINYLADYKVPQDWDELSPQKQQMEKLRMAFLAQKGWFYDEFGQKISGMMKEAGHMSEYRGLLRNLDDGKEKYEYRTINRGVDTVERPYLALLANMTPADLQSYAGRGAPLWNDGFWARFAFVSPPQDAPRIRGRFPKERRVIPYDLLTPLLKWDQRLGTPNVEVMNTSEDGKKSSYEVMVEQVEPAEIVLADQVYDAFNNYREALIDLVNKSELTDLDGNYSRLPEKAIRIAALFASLEGCHQIEMRHWARAQSIAEKWRRNLHDLYSSLTSGGEYSKKKTEEDKICSLLEKKGELTAREISQGTKLSSEEVMASLDSLMKIGNVVVSKANSKTQWYALTG